MSGDIVVCDKPKMIIGEVGAIDRIILPEGCKKGAFFYGKPDTTLRFEEGSIPDGLVELDVRSNAVIFGKNCTPPSLERIFVQDLVDGSTYPNDIDIFVWDYSGKVQIPVGPRIFIHANSVDNIKDDCDCFVYNIGLENIQVCDRFIVGEQSVVNHFNGIQTIATLKTIATPVHQGFTDKEITELLEKSNRIQSEQVNAYLAECTAFIKKTVTERASAGKFSKGTEIFLPPNTNVCPHIIGGELKKIFPQFHFRVSPLGKLYAGYH